MSINLRDITNENWLECIFLTTNKEDKHFVCEEFVASNALSLAQSKIQKGWITKAIYSDETIVGFTMYGYCEQYHFFEICRLMIDHKHQGKGYGKTALLQVIEEMRKDANCNEVFLSFEPNNFVAKQLYESIGFEDTSRMVEGEYLYKLPLKGINSSVMTDNCRRGEL